MAEKCFPTPKTLKDFSADAETFNKAINGSVADAPNINREGVDVENLLKWRQHALEAAAGAARLQTYLTVAQMRADTSQPVPTTGQVTNDPDTDSNGYYVWDGTSWLWSGLQPSSASRVDSIEQTLSEQGDAISQNADDITLKADNASPALTGVPTAPSANLAYTDSLQIANLNAVLALTRAHRTVAITSPLTVLTAEQSRMPVVSFTGALTADAVVEIPVDENQLLRTFRCLTVRGHSLTVRHVGQDGGIVLYRGDVVDTISNGVTLSTIGVLPSSNRDRISGGWFTNDGYYINAGNGNNLTASQFPSGTTDFIDISFSRGIKIRGKSSSVIALVAFYDRAQRFIGAIRGNEYDAVDVTIDKSDFPAGAYYIRATGYGSENGSYLVPINDCDVSGAVGAAVASQSDLSSLLKPNYYWRPNRGLWPNQDYKYTDPIPVKVGDKFFASTSAESSSGTIENPVFDASKKVIGQFDVLSPTLEVTQEMWDAGVRYVGFSYRPNDRRTLACYGAGDNLVARLIRVEEKTNRIRSNSTGLSGIMLIGASLAHDENSWFGDAAKSLSIEGYNKAISGSVPYEFGNMMWRNTLFSDEQFENSDILALQFASSPDIHDTDGLMSAYEDYTANFDLSDPSNQFRSNYTHAQTVDYILKKWQAMCYSQKDNPQSKWYGTKSGKPCLFLFVSHWHDARVQYNSNVRILAKRWGSLVCPFDEKIGFSKDAPLQNGEQVSRLYAMDTQAIDGVLYGFHPLRGDEGRYIQSKMAGIFSETIKSGYALSQ